MNKILMASLAVLVLVVSIGSQTLVHSAEAKGMSKIWLNSDGTLKTQYLKILHGTTEASHKFPVNSGNSHHK